MEEDLAGLPAQRPQHLIGVGLGLDVPGCAGHGFEGGNDLDPAKVPAFVDAVSVLPDHVRGESRVGERDAPFRRARAGAARRRDEDDIVALDPQQQGLRGIARNRPGLRHRKQQGERVGAEDQHARGFRQGQQEVDAVGQAGGIDGMHVVESEAAAGGGLRDRLPERGLGCAGFAGLQQGAAVRGVEADCRPFPGFEQGIEMQADMAGGVLRGIRREPPRGLEKVRVAPQDFRLLAAAVDPAPDLDGLEFGDGGLLAMLLLLEGGGLVAIGEDAGAGNEHDEQHKSQSQQHGAVTVRHDLCGRRRRAHERVHHQCRHGHEAESLPGLDEEVRLAIRD
jgi:hypothetical protein